MLSVFTISNAQTSINITYANDSDLFYWCGKQPPPVFTEFTVRAIVQGFNPTDVFYFRAEFGDGTYQSYSFDPLNFGNPGDTIVATFNHNYLSFGTFDVKYIIQGPNGIADTLFVPDEVIITDACAPLLVRTFVDKNANCSYDAGDSMVVAPVILKNGLAYYYTNNIWWDAATGVNYTAYIDPVAIQNLGFNLMCPASGFINITHNGPDTIDFALDCNANFDLVAISTTNNNFRIGNSSLLFIEAANVSCIPQSGVATLSLGSDLNYATAFIPPSSISGSNISWNFFNLGNTHFTTPFWNLVYVNLAPSVSLGDTVCYTFSVTPTAGDINTTNNTIVPCYAVKSAWDPNYKDVNPHGQGTAGNVLPGTDFTYTIGFQNTGNDTATDVYLIDTLDADLNINSLEILFASHPMQLSIIDGTILRFQFDHIMLPDSNANEMLSHGFVVYKIKHKQGIPNGSQIFNTAYIYFDQNPAVVTNTILNTIDISLGINEKEAGLISLYPNPANTTLTLKLINENKRQIILIDVLGNEILKQEASSKEVLIDVNKIPNGIYFLMIKEKESTMFQKVIISR
jgi:uncharacterized repeat protein (TIGR01451 family)